MFSFQALPYECFICSSLQSLLCFSLSLLQCGTYSCNKPIQNWRVDCKKSMGNQWHFLRHYWGQGSMSLPFHVISIAYSTSVMNSASSLLQEVEYKTMDILETCTSLIVICKCFAVAVTSQEYSLKLLVNCTRAKVFQVSPMLSFRGKDKNDFCPISVEM